MPHFQLIDCKIKIQIRVGYFPDGRARTRTFGVGPVRPDASADDVAAVAHAIAPLLAFPIVCVRLVRKYICSRDEGAHGKTPPAADLFGAGGINAYMVGDSSPENSSSSPIKKTFPMRSAWALHVSVKPAFENTQ